MSKAALPERAASPTRTSQSCSAGPQPTSRVTLRRAVQTSARPSQVPPAGPPVHEVVQPKLAIGAVDDPLEHEADRVADHVMRMPDPALSIGAVGRQISRTCAASTAGEQQKPQLKQETSRVADQVMRKAGGPPRVSTSAPPASRCCAARERQEPIGGAGAAHGSGHAAPDHVAEAVGGGGTPAAFTLSSQRLALSRKCAGCEGEEEKKLQMKPAGAAAPAVSAAPLVHDALRASGRPLDHSTRAFMEPHFGRDFSHVRVHTDCLASRSAEAVAARAYTVGPNIAFRSGEYAPDTVAGRSLLAHELAHVVQQGGAQPATLRRVHVDATGRKQFDSPDYADDPKLEACLNDEDRLRPGARGATVAKVQRGLLRDGADLGPTGADGVYGQHTETAVRQFKKKYTLGAEQFGDVGPGTMAQLDALGTSPGPTPPTPPKPEPFSSRSFHIVGKSFIRRIDATGTLSCGPDRVNVTPELIVLAQLTDSMMGETAPTDARDGGYRMFSAATVVVTCMFGKPVSVAFGHPFIPGPARGELADIDTDNGREGPLETPPLIIFDKSITRGPGRPLRFAWSVKGRPALAAESGFQLVCPRTSRYIWHRIEGEVDCGELKNMTISGSHFPTHRLYADGALKTTLPQGSFSNLWIPAASDPTMVK